MRGCPRASVLGTYSGEEQLSVDKFYNISRVTTRISPRKKFQRIIKEHLLEMAAMVTSVPITRV